MLKVICMNNIKLDKNWRRQWLRWSSTFEKRLTWLFVVWIRKLLIYFLGTINLPLALKWTSICFCGKLLLWQNLNSLRNRIATWKLSIYNLISRNSLDWSRFTALKLSIDSRDLSDWSRLAISRLAICCLIPEAYLIEVGWPLQDWQYAIWVHKT